MWLIIHLIIILGLSVRVALRPRRDPASRIAWILFIAVAPYFGALVYLLLGEVRLGSLRQKALNKPMPLPQTASIPPMAESAFAIAHSINGFVPVATNAGKLLDSSNATIDALVADIDAAQEHVHLLFYIWLPDNNGLKVVEAMVRAALRGVVCRVIVDDLGSRTLIRSKHWQAMKSAGVNLARAQKIGNIMMRIAKGRIDVRNHRKIIVIDNWVTYCGSQNCADPEFLVKAKYAPWVDAVIRFEGAVARQNQQLFLMDWFNSTREDLFHLVESPMPSCEQGFIAQAIGTGPESTYSAMPELFSTLMFSARRELVITTPYYVPDDFMQASLCSSARRGVATTLILPARNDNRFVGATSRSYYSELLDAGVCIYEYVGGLLHTKSLTVDGELTLIGSANMDRRSFDLNFENNILFYDRALTQSVCDRQKEYIAQARRITQEEVAAWRWPYRLRNNILAMLSPIL